MEQRSYLAGIDHILRLKEVCEITGLGRSTIYELVRKEQFPKQVKLTARSVGWRQSQVVEWISSRESA
ncbi:AlpA family transcriptional regulator [Oleiphilus sp. HI0073]|uniref:helix-turn-helix transcriptional regulator n=1 Tax=Oleiphilus sp. HI0080 TaxID=1822255 RepID=UPI0007C3B93F|nr:AlpA family transcriptional regulator [Oleiphilus sp. HI0080]KZY60194.1 AlpA family transcriptional regulator [Oleiphilus sp. HI0065]KZY92845.1 AlpA family transcriptional regulator [Oleiphilus sp. HI0073]KZZ49680.1 AlpA family transcriptional regulator [Oleiphilus sp. HI0122]KZY67931.1 AlpA family transcriptional regulator [Oleiphilus sp. HI0065]KZY96092.1 AlpA family transcriptional regulator [Oleiphilus sp. HI0073]